MFLCFRLYTFFKICKYILHIETLLCVKIQIYSLHHIFIHSMCHKNLNFACNLSDRYLHAYHGYDQENHIVRLKTKFKTLSKDTKC